MVDLIMHARNAITTLNVINLYFPPVQQPET